METEIEIKFFFSTEFELELYETINSHRYIANKKQLLHNVYFDTAGRSLRKMAMCLRVRTCDDKSVQTVKTAGRVIGGLHQRPEYNEVIEGLRPELARFNSKIWPENCSIKELENELIPIFSTDFERQTWLVEMPDDTLIEVAYDKGFIETNQGKVEICEIELELVKGDEKQLFILGDDIALLPQARLGNVSKAQRGYMLADGSSFAVKPLVHSPLDPSMSVDQALLTNMQHGLRHIQYHEHCYCEQFNDDALKEFLKGIKFLHQNLKLFKSAQPVLLEADWIEDLHWLARTFSWLDERFINQNLLEDKGHYLRKLPKYKSLVKKLQAQNEQLPSQQAVLELLCSTRYCQFILKFTNWMIQFEKSTFSNDNADSIKAFSSHCLDTVWGELMLALEEQEVTSTSHILSCQGLLEGTLLTGLSVGNVFSQQRSIAFRSPWLDIKQGIEGLAMLDVIVDMAEQEDNSELQNEYFKWIKRKEESLLHAVEQSKQQAVQKEIYWHSTEQ
ncbi:CYTH and CHAD domain-containing protein [Psychromonas aquimarina]|uniref:CYTH and CHAD domain-containing protein n=1 Tax=Psychromonas aquimarina TaxID=444919 RepID=UPI00040E71A6|nr:CYTH and CHAD domain-containing protein [Psychromonas aquimarina]